MTSGRRETLYWLTVVATFAMGTALGDFTVYTRHLGYFSSAALFAGIIAVPAVGYRLFRWNRVFTFWFAYVVTRPLGVSIADRLGKPKAVSGLGLGDGWIALGFAILIFLMVAYLATAQADARTAVPAFGTEQA